MDQIEKINKDIKGIINLINLHGELLEKHNELLIKHDEIIKPIHDKDKKNKINERSFEKLNLEWVKNNSENREAYWNDGSFLLIALMVYNNKIQKEQWEFYAIQVFQAIDGNNNKWYEFKQFDSESFDQWEPEDIEYFVVLNN